MKFLVDNQLPGALARFLTERGHPSLHVLDLKMDEAKDVRIWNRITKNGLGLVTKDEDFLHLANRPGQTGKLLWVRIGNCRKQVLLRSFQRELPRIVRAFGEGQRIVEIR